MTIKIEVFIIKLFLQLIKERKMVFITLKSIQHFWVKCGSILHFVYVNYKKKGSIDSRGKNSRALNS